MSEPLTWREQLSTVISSTSVREQIASAMHISSITLNRWASGESMPRAQNLRQLEQAVPVQYRSALHKLLEKEFPTLFSASSEMLDISYAFIIQVLETSAKTSDALRFWTITHLVLQQALRQLDAERMGIAMTVVRCMPPSSEGKIRSLRESAGQGTPPWEPDLETKGMFLGAESLAGYVVTTCHEEAVQNLATDTTLLPAYQTEYEVSAVAVPILHANRIAGCLLISSTQPNYFLVLERRALIQAYTYLITLAFEPNEFYPSESVELSIMPLLDTQKRYFASFRQRVHDTMREATAGTQHPVTGVKAEQRVWQQLEEELSGLFLQSALKDNDGI